jgi:hypothetical protein
VNPPVLAISSFFNHLHFSLFTTPRLTSRVRVGFVVCSGEPFQPSLQPDRRRKDERRASRPETQTDLTRPRRAGTSERATSMAVVWVAPDSFLLPPTLSFTIAACCLHCIVRGRETLFSRNGNSLLCPNRTLVCCSLVLENN